LAHCRRPNDSASAFASSRCSRVCPRMNHHAIGSEHRLDVRPCGFSPDDESIQSSIAFRHRSSQVMRRRVLFRRDVPLPADRILTWPGRSIAFGKLFASCPAARLPNTFETGGAHGIFALRSFYPVRRSLGLGDPLRAESCFANRCLHLADPPAVCLMPSSVYFCRGIGRSNFFTHILHKKRTIAGIQDRLLGFSSGQAVPITARSAAIGQSCLGHFSSSRSLNVNETRSHRLDPVRAIGSRPPLPAPYRSWASRRCSQVRPAWCDFAYDVPAIGGPSAY